MNMSRQLEYNKKGKRLVWITECLPKIKCHFFITTIKMIRRNKMIVMSFSTFIIKVLVFILLNLLSKRLEVVNNLKFKTILF